MAIAIIEEFINITVKRFNMPVKYFRTDGEKALGNRFEQLVADHSIAIERSASITPAQNGATERSRGVILSRAYYLRISANLPSLI
jgi:hypothetical protein